MGHEGRLVGEQQDGGRRAHALQGRRLVASLYDGHIGTSDSLDNHIGSCLVLIGLVDTRYNLVDSNGRCRLATRTASHTVAHGNDKSALRLFREIGVLILCPTTNAGFRKADKDILFTIMQLFQFHNMIKIMMIILMMTNSPTAIPAARTQYCPSHRPILSDMGGSGRRDASMASLNALAVW